ncbi:hypothetical protein [Rhodobacter ferrooxidans]|uniref:hypothetical protein n=1 Tax=Rhodobacter ferrooxidans TaxID=371731 RepID=UPI0012EB0219|nr:hypothetical protein [Rhodobacter sp. SW2]
MFQFKICNNSSLLVTVSLFGRVRMVDKQFGKYVKLSKPVSRYFNEGVEILQSHGFAKEPGCPMLSSWCAEVGETMLRGGPIEQKVFYEKPPAHWVNSILES